MGSKKLGVVLATATLGCSAAGLLGASAAVADDYVGGTPTQQGPAVEAVSATSTTTTGGRALAVTGADIAEAGSGRHWDDRRRCRTCPSSASTRAGLTGHPTRGRPVRIGYSPRAPSATLAMNDVAYLITAYRSPPQLGRLVRRIEAEHHGRVLLHIDGKVPIRPFQDACAGTAAEFLEQRQTVTYTAFSSVRAKVRLATAALTAPFMHAVLMSEHGYPIKPLAALEAFLADHPEHDFINIRDVRREMPELVERYERFHFPDWPNWAPRWKAEKVLARIRRRSPHRVSIRRLCLVDPLP